MKTVIIYGSQHHGNTERLVKSIAENRDIDVFCAEDAAEISLDEYDIIGFASGIDFGKFYPQVISMAEKTPGK